MTDIGGGWYLKKCARGLPPFNRTKISKKAQERKDCIQNKLYESNRWCNYCKFRFHWNKLEWVDPKYTPKIFKPFSVSSKKLYTSKNYRTDHFVGHSQLK